MKKILIFGGSGFVGSQLIEKILLKDKFVNKVDIVCTNQKKAESKFRNTNINIKIFNIFDETILKKNLQDYDIIINLIGKLFEAKKGQFDEFHCRFPELLAKNISDKQFLIHVSALAIEKSCKSSLYARSKLDGEKSIINNTKNYTIIRPSIIFGKEDNFFNLFAQMSELSPILPLIGGGEAKFAPIYVKDLCESMVTIIENTKHYKESTYEAYGPKVASFKELMQFILNTINKKRVLMNIPFKIAKIQAKIVNFLRIYILTSDQVELLKYNNVASNKLPNIDKIIGKLEKYEDIVPTYIKKS